MTPREALDLCEKSLVFFASLIASQGNPGADAVASINLPYLLHTYTRGRGHSDLFGVWYVLWYIFHSPTRFPADRHRYLFSRSAGYRVYFRPLCSIISNRRHLNGPVGCSYPAAAQTILTVLKNSRTRRVFLTHARPLYHSAHLVWREVSRTAATCNPLLSPSPTPAPYFSNISATHHTGYPLSFPSLF